MSIKNSIGTPDTVIHDQHSLFDIRTNYRLSTMFLNNTDIDISVVNQSNLAVPVAANSHLTNNDKSFIIRHIYQFITHEAICAVINNINLIRNRYNQLPPEMKILHDVLLDNFNKINVVSNLNISIDRHIGYRVLASNTHYFVEEENLLLHMGKFDPSVPHPRSVIGKTLGEYMENIGERTVSGMFVEIVDNDNNIHTRYMYAAKQILEIPELTDSTRENGVYYTHIENDPLTGSKLNPIHYTFSQAESELGIYPNKEQAATEGNPDRISGTHLKDLEHQLHAIKIEQKRKEEEFKHAEFNRNAELKLLEGELKQADIENQRKLNEQIIHIEEMKFENAKLKEKLEKEKAKTDRFKAKVEKSKSRREDKSNKKSHDYNNRKLASADYYEQRSYDRKDNTEALKTGALILTTGISIFALMGKLK